MPPYSTVNQALMSTVLRARRMRRGDIPYVPMPTLAPALTSANSQVITGRGGTGKSHLLLDLERQFEDSGRLAVVLDLRGVGSASDLYLTGEAPDLPTRATRLAVDVLSAIHSAVRGRLLEKGLMEEEAARHLDELASAITRVRVAGEEERSETIGTESRSSSGGKVSIGVSPQALLEATVGHSAEDSDTEARSTVVIQRGHADVWLHLGSVRQAFEGLAACRNGIAVMLDEWNSVPGQLQPWLADLIRRLLWDASDCVVKITARGTPLLVVETPEGLVGLSDRDTSTIDLDVHRAANMGQERGFLLALLYAHARLTLLSEAMLKAFPSSVEEFSERTFSEGRACDRLTEAAEGNPRDLLVLAGKAAELAGDQPISVGDVAVAANWLAESHKSCDYAPRGLARWLRDEVLRDGSSRSFFVPTEVGRIPSVLSDVYERRLLHRGDHTAMNVTSDPLKVFTEWHVDYGYAVQIMRSVVADVKQIQVPPIGGYSDDKEVPRFEVGVVESERINTETIAVGERNLAQEFVRDNQWVKAAIRALPPVGDFLIADTGKTIETFALIDSPVDIGRSHDAAIRLLHNSVSRRHATLTENEHVWRIVDCDSTNGVLVNGEPHQWCELRQHDVVSIGAIRLFFIRQDPPQEPDD